VTQSVWHNWVYDCESVVISRHLMIADVRAHNATDLARPELAKHLCDTLSSDTSTEHGVGGLGAGGDVQHSGAALGHFRRGEEDGGLRSRISSKEGCHSIGLVMLTSIFWETSCSTISVSGIVPNGQQ
jgi:hypothetical protein